MQCYTPPELAMALYIGVGLLAILLLLHIVNDRQLRKLLDHELTRLNATLNMNYKMSLSIMATVPDAIKHNRETYEDSNVRDMEEMQKPAPDSPKL